MKKMIGMMAVAMVFGMSAFAQQQVEVRNALAIGLRDNLRAAGAEPASSPSAEGMTPLAAEVRCFLRPSNPAAGAFLPNCSLVVFTSTESRQTRMPQESLAPFVRVLENALGIDPANAPGTLEVREIQCNSKGLESGQASCFISF